MAKKKSIFEDRQWKFLGELQEDGTYVQKSGDKYLEAIGVVLQLDNRNDNPFTISEIKSAPLFKDFQFEGKQEFKYICELEIKPFVYKDIENIENEKIYAINFSNNEAQEIFKSKPGIVYIFTCEIDGKEHIIKIGSSIHTFKKRLASYNCGAINNWRTASTTNIKFVQSMVVTRLNIKVYVCVCGETQRFSFHGYTSDPIASSMRLAVENIVVNLYIDQFKSKPIFNVQTNSSTDSNANMLDD